MRISDWSSDVCSSDLVEHVLIERRRKQDTAAAAARPAHPALHRRQSFKMDGEHLAGVDGQPRLQRHAAEGNVLDRRRAIDPRAFDARRNADDVTRRAGRSEARRVGKEGGSPCTYRWSPYT